MANDLEMTGACAWAILCPNCPPCPHWICPSDTSSALRHAHGQGLGGRVPISQNIYHTSLYLHFYFNHSFLNDPFDTLISLGDWYMDCNCIRVSSNCIQVRALTGLTCRDSVTFRTHMMEENHNVTDEGHNSNYHRTFYGVTLICTNSDGIGTLGG